MRVYVEFHNFLKDLISEFCMFTVTLVTWRVCITVIIFDVIGYRIPPRHNPQKMQNYSVHQYMFSSVIKL